MLAIAMLETSSEIATLAALLMLHFEPEASIIDTFCNLIRNRISPILNYTIAVDYNHMR